MAQGKKIVRDPRLTSNPTNHPSCICQWGQNCAISRAHFETRKCYVTPGFGVSGGLLSFMSTCRLRTCYITPGFWVSGGCYRSCQLDAHAHATSRQGLGCQGGVIVHVNLTLTHMLHHARVLGVRGGVIVHVNLTRTHMLHHARVWGVRGGVIVHVNLTRTHMLHHARVWGVRGGVIVHVNLPHTHMRRHARVDAMWRSKLAIPCSLAARVNSQVNPKLMPSIRVWQWRWMNSKAKNLLEITGCSLQKRMAMWKEENTARVWQSRFPVNCRSWSRIQWKFPENVSRFFWNRSIVSLWRKQHFFQHAHNRWRGFPPDRMYIISP